MTGCGNKIGPYDCCTIVTGDAKELAKAIPDESVDLIVTSPPYYNAKAYSWWPAYEDYLDDMAMVWGECSRILAIGGRIAVNIAAGYGRSPWLPISVDVTKQLQDVGLLLRGHVVWDKGQQNAGSTAWGSWKSASNPTLRERHEFIVMASKEQWGKGHKGESTISRDEFLAYTQTLWVFNAETHSWHSAPFPIELPLRCIKLLSYRDDTVFDPFVGSGTTAVASLQTGRHYLAFEIDPDVAERARERVQNTQPPLFVMQPEQAELEEILENG